MKRTGSIKGIIRNNKNNPLKDVAVAIVSGPSHPDIASISGSDGKFSLSNLTTGKYIIKATGSNAESEEIQVSVYATKEAFVEIWLNSENNDNGTGKKDIFPLDNGANETDEM